MPAILKLPFELPAKSFPAKSPCLCLRMLSQKELTRDIFYLDARVVKRFRGYVAVFILFVVYILQIYSLFIYKQSLKRIKVDFQTIKEFFPKYFLFTSSRLSKSCSVHMFHTMMSWNLTSKKSSTETELWALEFGSYCHVRSFTYQSQKIRFRSPCIKPCFRKGIR